MAGDHTPKALFSDWLVIVFSIYTYGSATGIPISLSVMFLDWQDTFNATRAHTAVVHSACFSIVLGGAVFAGYMTNRIGARLTILIGSALATAGMFVSAFATSINFLIVSVGVVAGFGFSCIQLPAIPCATSVTKRYKTVAISLCAISCAVVGILNRYLLRYLIDQYSWRGACIIIAGLTFQTCAGGLIITAKLEPSKNSLLANEDKAGNLTNKEIEFKSSDENVSPMIVNGSANKLNQLVNDNHFDDKVSPMIVNGSTNKLNQSVTGNHFDVEVYQVKESAQYCTNLPISTSLSRPGSQIIIFENDFNSDGDCDSKSDSDSNYTKHNSSRWRFFCDMMFILLSAHIGSCLAPLFSFCLILMDFAKTLGFDDSTGVTFLSVTFAASIIGRMGVGILGDLCRIHSFVLQIAFAVPGCTALLFLSFATGYGVVICLLAISGVSLGGLIAIYPKCALDVKSVNVKSFPIAFGFFCTVEGIMGLLSAIAIGVFVDITGSYTLILIFIGCIGLLSTFLLGLGYLYSQRQQRLELKTKQQVKIQPSNN